MDSFQRGQALLVVVLVMVVALTVGLSLSIRSITDLRNSREEENSQRAFSAAEAGVEQALTLQAGTAVIADEQLNNNSVIDQVDITEIKGDNFVVNDGNVVDKNDGVDIWLSNYPDYSSSIPNIRFFNIYWGSPLDDCSKNSAAIEVIVLTGPTSSPISTRYAYDPCATRRASNSFDVPNSGSFSLGGKVFGFRTPLNSIKPIKGGLIVRVTPLYHSTSVGVYTCNAAGQNCTALPAQGRRIESTGTSGSTVRKINYFQGFPKLPVELFNYILFSPK